MFRILALGFALTLAPALAFAGAQQPPGMATDASNASTPQTARLNLGLHKNVTPEDFGAKGDDTTDDTAAINSAVSAALAQGYTLSFLHKPYKVTSTITIDVGPRSDRSPHRDDDARDSDRL